MRTVPQASYTKPQPTEGQQSSGTNNNPATNEAIRKGDIVGATDAEASMGNELPVVARKLGPEKVAMAAEKGAIGAGNNPVSTTVSAKGPKVSRIERFFALNIAKAELIIEKIVHAPIHILAQISEVYGPMDSPIGVYLDQRFPTQPLINFLAEEALSPLDELLERTIEYWEHWVDYYENYNY